MKRNIFIKIINLTLLLIIIQFISSCTMEENNKSSSTGSGNNLTNSISTDLYRGINLGNALDAPNEGDWGWTIQENHFNVIHNAGFDHVRIPIRWSNHAETAYPYTIDQSFFDRVDWVIDNVLSRGMVAIINMHHYNELFSNPEENRERFFELWRQISTHYRNYSDQLYFELLNEPNTNLTPDLWNQYLTETYNMIRITNPSRYIIIDTPLWGNYEALDYLELPENYSNIIVSFHYYNPWDFCFQGADWLTDPPEIGIQWNGTEYERNIICQGLDYTVEWSRNHNNIPLWNGEYGVHHWADYDSRIRWISFVTREAERRGIANAIWSFHISDSAGLYDPDTGEWLEELLHAVIPE